MSSPVGSFFEIDDAVRNDFAACTTRGMWYDVMGRHLDKNSYKLRVGDAIGLWLGLGERTPGPLQTFFSGDLRAAPDGTGNPEVCFSGSSTVSEALKALRLLTAQEIARDWGPLGEEFIVSKQRELCEFLAPVVTRSKAIVLLWY